MLVVIRLLGQMLSNVVPRGSTLPARHTSKKPYQFYSILLDTISNVNDH
jgi:hypothetical protein